MNFYNSIQKLGENMVLCSEIPAKTEKSEFLTFLLKFGKIKFDLFIII